jgi:hypothetical protein
MEEVVNLHGKLYHFWEVDKGHDLPLGQPKLMWLIDRVQADKRCRPQFREVPLERLI